MAESFIQLPPDSTGKKTRTFSQVVGANTVEHQALVMCDSAGNIMESAATTPTGTERALAVRQVGAVTGTPDLRFAGGKTAYAAVLSTAGGTVAITPAAGLRVRVVWVAFIPNSDNTAANLVTVSLGSTVLYIGYAMAHWEAFTGAVNGTVTVDLSNTQPVAVTIHYEVIS